MKAEIVDRLPPKLSLSPIKRDGPIETQTPLMHLGCLLNDDIRVFWKEARHDVTILRVPEDDVKTFEVHVLALQTENLATARRCVQRKPQDQSNRSPECADNRASKRAASISFNGRSRHLLVEGSSLISNDRDCSLAWGHGAKRMTAQLVRQLLSFGLHRRQISSKASDRARKFMLAL